MQVCHVTSSISRIGAGLSKAVIDLAENQVLKGLAVKVVALEDRFTLEDTSSTSVTIDPCKIGCVTKFGYSPRLKQAITVTGDIDIIHSHGLWMYPNYAAGRVAHIHGIPHVLSPHGMLEPWALRNHGKRKKMIWHLFQKTALSRAKILHATAEPEAENFRALGLKNPIAVVANGVDVPSTQLVSKVPERTRKMLFLSRIHPKKGLLNLVEAWRQTRPEGWRVVIAGPDEGGHADEVRQYIRESGLESCFDLVGPLYDEAKWVAYQAADVFVLPSFSENFGIVVAEALAAGIPVITTRATPWSELQSHGCGWWIDVGVEPLAAAIREATVLSDGARNEMGLRGRELIHASYSWPKIATEMLQVYEWLLGGGNPPVCVMTD